MFDVLRGEKGLFEGRAVSRKKKGGTTVRRGESLKRRNEVFRKKKPFSEGKKKKGALKIHLPTGNSALRRGEKGGGGGYPTLKEGGKEDNPFKK